MVWVWRCGTILGFRISCNGGFNFFARRRSYVKCFRADMCQLSFCNLYIRNFRDILFSTIFGFTIFCCLRVLAENAVEVFLLILSNLYLVFSGFSWVSFVQCEKKKIFSGSLGSKTSLIFPGSTRQRHSPLTICTPPQMRVGWTNDPDS